MALMLSSQTKDEVTHAAIGALRTALNGLTLDNVLAADDSVISGAIAKVGFWRRKTEYIKKVQSRGRRRSAARRSRFAQASQKLRDDFDSDVPKTVDELCSLPGVGPKMAFLCLQSAWKLLVYLTPVWLVLTDAPQERRHRRRHARAPHQQPPRLAQACDHDAGADAVRRGSSYLPADADNSQAESAVVAPEGAALRRQPHARGLRTGAPPTPPCRAPDSDVRAFVDDMCTHWAEMRPVRAEREEALPERSCRAGEVQGERQGEGRSFYRGRVVICCAVAFLLLPGLLYSTVPQNRAPLSARVISSGTCRLRSLPRDLRHTRAPLSESGFVVSVIFV